MSQTILFMALIVVSLLTWTLLRQFASDRIQRFADSRYTRQTILPARHDHGSSTRQLGELKRGVA